MTDGVHIDLGSLGTELKLVDARFATAVRKNVRAAVAEAGAEILAKVRQDASWSTRIPDATKLTTSFAVNRNGITIRTSASKAPHARPLEMGNQNSYDESAVTSRVSSGAAVSRRHAISQLRGEGAGTRGLRHPVYGKGWAVMPTRPYFFRAADEATPETEAAFHAAIDRAVREAGFH